MGSSMVMTWQFRLALMWSTMAARVVDLPDPVVPVTRISPLRSRAIFLSTSGMFRSSSWGGSVGTILNTMPKLPLCLKQLTLNRATPERLWAKSISLVVSNLACWYWFMRE